MLHLAAQEGHDEICRILVKCPLINPALKNLDNMTAEDLCELAKPPRMQQTLLALRTGGVSAMSLHTPSLSVPLCVCLFLSYCSSFCCLVSSISPTHLYNDTCTETGVHRYEGISKGPEFSALSNFRISFAGSHLNVCPAFYWFFSIRSPSCLSCFLYICTRFGYLCAFLSLFPSLKATNGTHFSPAARVLAPPRLQTY